MALAVKRVPLFIYAFSSSLLFPIVKALLKANKKTTLASRLLLLSCSCLLLSCLFDASAVEGGGISLCVGKMFLIGLCKAVGATEVLVGAHVEIVVMLHVQHCIEAVRDCGRCCRGC